MITLFDISSSLEPQAWSPNTWKARLVLNYKQIPYQTKWISLPDVTPTLESLGISPRTVGLPYALPIISVEGNHAGADPKRTLQDNFIVDSYAIAEYLDQHFPSTPSVFPRGTAALQASFYQQVSQLVYRPLLNLLIPVAIDKMNEDAKEYYRTSREGWYGCSLEEICPKGTRRDAEWEKVRQGLDTISSMMEKNEAAGDGGKWLMGELGPIFIDFVLAALFIWPEKVALGGEWEMCKKWNGGRWAKLREAVEPYMRVI